MCVTGTPSHRRETRTRLPAGQRRAQIVDAAAHLFRQRGYNSVGIDDIGAAVGISGPAVYRHIASKEALVAEIGTGLLDDMVAETHAVLAQARAEGWESRPTLDHLMSRSVAVGLEHTAALTVSVRHLWGLDAGLAAPLSQRWAELQAMWGPVVGAVHPHLRVEDAGLTIRAAAGMLIGGERALTDLPHDRANALLSDAMAGLMSVRLPPPSRPNPQPTGIWTRSSRRERLLETSIALFRERGYGGVSLADIAEAVGVTASASYRHFDNKEELLTTAIDRAGDRVVAGVSEALRHAVSAEDALDRLLRSYAQICVDNSDLVAVAVTERYHLTDDAKARRRMRARLVVEEWAHCLAVTRPDLTSSQASALAVAVQGMVIECVRSSALSRRPDLADELYRLARSILS